MLKPMLLLSAAAVSLGACASLPDATYHYYPAKSATAFSVTQTITCTGDKQGVIITSAPQAPVTSFSADYLHGPYDFHMKDIDSTFADTDATVTFTEDGRLKTINATTTGQGETILKSAISFAAALAPLMAMAAPAHAAPPDAAGDCKQLTDWVGADKPGTLTFTSTVDLAKTTSFDLTDASSASVAVSDKALYGRIGKKSQVLVSVVETKSVSPVETYKPDARTPEIALPLQRSQNLKVQYKVDGNVAASSFVTVPVPCSDKPEDVANNRCSDFVLPVPKADWFGNGKTALTLSDGGAITSIEYGKTSGAAGVMNVGTAAAQAAAPPAAPTGP